MSFERACAVADVPEDEGYAATIGAYDVVVARCGEDIYALQDRCSHAAVELSDGEVEDCAIECWLHGSTFDLKSGEALVLPATEPVATFATEIREGDVYIDTTKTLNGVTPQ